MQLKPEAEPALMESTTEQPQTAGLTRRVEVHAMREGDATANDSAAERVCLDVRNLDLFYSENQALAITTSRPVTIRLGDL